VRRKELLRAASTVFAERGYEGAKVEQIAEAAGVSPGLLYRHFPGKKELHQELVQAGGEELLERAAEAASPDYEGVKRLERGVDAFFGFVAENPDVWRMLMRDDPEPHVAMVREAIYQRAIDEVLALVAEDPLAAKQELRDQDLEMIAVVIVGAAQAMATWWTAHPQTPRAGMVQSLMNVLWVGLDRLAAGERYGA
jgi:AcrR family transcriptional regulator